jgi:ElaB/YqjD/DUF883 family membrane-anchored ribosome-binding protein
VTDYRATEPGWNGEASGEDQTTPEVEALAQDIEETRDEMSGTVEAIADRLNPANIVQDAKETVREATVGKVEQMANNVAETASGFVDDARYTAQDAGSGILETVKRNPIPAAMAGIGIGWLLMNRQSGNQSRRSSWDQARWTGSDQGSRYGGGYDAYGTYSGSRGSGQGLTDRAGGAVEQVGQQAGQIADTVGSKVGDVADQARSTAQQVPNQVGHVARDVQWNAQRMVEDNPLAVGAIAVAVGAAIGMVLPETQTEQKVLGPAAEKAISTAEQTAHEAVQQLETANR